MFCAGKVLGDAALADDPRFATNRARVDHRAETDAPFGGVFARFDVEPLMAMLQKADIAFARVNDCALLSQHPHLRRISVRDAERPGELPAPAALFNESHSYGRDAVAGREHTETVRGRL